MQWLLIKGFAQRQGARQLDAEVNCSPVERQEGPGGAALSSVGHIQIFDSIMKTHGLLCFRPSADPSYSRQPPNWPMSLFGPQEFKVVLWEWLSVHRNHVMKLAIPTKQVSIKEYEPRPRDHCL